VEEVVEETEEEGEAEAEEEEAARGVETAGEEAAARVRSRAAVAAMADGTRAATTTAANTRGVTRARSRQDPVPHGYTAATRPDRSERGCCKRLRQALLLSSPTYRARGADVLPQQHHAALAKSSTHPPTPFGLDGLHVCQRMELKFYE
jgi:hypothetical protein